jgi:hypothetical protein
MEDLDLVLRSTVFLGSILGWHGRFGPSALDLLHWAFQPHLDQMQHAPINEPARYRFQ